MEHTHQTFFIDYPESENDKGGPYEFHKKLEQIVKEKYDIEEYLIALETEPRIHYHFIVYTTLGNCINLIQQLVRKYDLKNKSGKHGGKNNYGRVKKPIDNLEKLKIYCCKEKNVLSSYSQETLEELYRKSFKKTTDIKSRLVQYLDEIYKDCIHEPNPMEIKVQIIQYLTENKIHVRKSLIDSYHIYYRQMSLNEKIKYTATQILLDLYPLSNNI